MRRQKNINIDGIFIHSYMLYSIFPIDIWYIMVYYVPILDQKKHAWLCLKRMGHGSPPKSNGVEHHNSPPLRMCTQCGR